MNKPQNKKGGRLNPVNPPNTKKTPRQRRSPNNGQVAQISNFVPNPRPIKGQTAVAAAYSTGQLSRSAKITQLKDSVRIVHRELVAGVTGSLAYAVPTTLALNPGLPASFPWLSTQAQGWERYRFNRLKYCFFTRASSATAGSVMLIPDYDASDSAPLSELIGSSYEDVSEDVPWKDIVCDLRPSALHAIGPSKFVRVGALAANQDIKTYDAGNLFVATLDGAVTSWGKLWVEYDVTLMTPQLQPGGTGVISAIHSLGALATTANELGTTQSLQAGSAAFATISTASITFNQAGKYLLCVSTSAATSVTETAVPTVSASGSFSPIMSLSAPFTAGSTTTVMIQEMIVNVVVGTIVSFNNTIVGAATTDIMLSQLPTGLA